MSMLPRFRNTSLRFSLSSIASSIKGNNNSNQIKYTKEEIDNAISEIKTLGKRAVESQNGQNGNQANANTISDIKTILKLMKQYESNLYVQRVSCHALSNLAMQVVIARYIITNNGFEYIRKALQNFPDDHKLCWLASSALWNMARPPANREIIGKSGVKLMLQVLSQHFKKYEKVTNTAIGALSNLSLCESLKSHICKKDNVALILDVLRLYCSPEQRSVSVMTSGAGLLANLAVSDDHAATLLQNDALPVVIQLLRWKSDNSEESEEDDSESSQNESTLHRNSCAALNNMVTADHFVDKILECNGVETIYSYLNDTKNDLFVQLLQNCLSAMGCDPQNPISSMHMSALHNRTDILKTLIANASSLDSQVDKMEIDDEKSTDSCSEVASVGSHIWGNKEKTWTVEQLLNQTDSNNMTVLQYAALGKHYELVEFLAKCGADTSVLDMSQDEDETEDQTSHRQSLEKAVSNAKITIESIANERVEAISETLDFFPHHLCQYMETFENDIDMLQVANQFN
jgi:hypothetical protein